MRKYVKHVGIAVAIGVGEELARRPSTGAEFSLRMWMARLAAGHFQMSNRSVPYGWVHMLRNCCSDLAFVGILGPVAGTESFDPGQGRGESPSDFGVRQRLAAHAAGRAGAGGPLGGAGGAPGAECGATNRPHRGLGAGTGPPQGTRPPRRPSLGFFGLQRPRQPAPILGTFAGRTAGARRPWPVADAGRARGSVDPAQAQRLPPMRPAADGRGHPIRGVTSRS